MSFARKKAYFLTNLTKLNSLFVFNAWTKAKIWSFLCESISNFLSPSLFPLPFLFISSLVTHFIVPLLHGIVAG